MLLKSKSVFVVLLVYLFNGQSTEKVDFSDIKVSFPLLLDSSRFCQNRRAALVTDKPVYRNGETVYITGYFYDLLSKEPKFRCRSSQYFSASVYDMQDKYIAGVSFNYNQLSQEQKQSFDATSVTVEYKIPDSLTGGVYKIKSTDEGEQEVRIFVMKFEARQLALVGDWNQENAKVGDLLEGKITLKVFTKDSPNISDSVISYSFSSRGRTLLENKASFANGQLDVGFRIPEEFEKLLVFSATATVAGVTLAYKKEFAEPTFDDIVIDFNAGNGKLVVNASNKIYFRAWEDKNRKFEVPIQDARLIRKIGNRAKVLGSSIRSTEDGKGAFSLPLEASDAEERAKFFLEVKFNEFSTRNFEILDANGFPTSPLLIRANRTYGLNDPLVVKVVSPDYDGEALLVLLNKSEVLHQKQFSVAKNSSEDHTIDLQSLNIQAGGVFTLQLYTPKKGTEASTSKSEEAKKPAEQAKPEVADQGVRIGIVPPYRPPSYKYIDNVDYQGVIQQEMEIFVTPSKVVGAKVEFNKQSFQPGDDVEYQVKVSRDCPSCLDPLQGGKVRAMIDVVDESAFVEIEKARQDPSLFTKVFLAKEILSPDNFFFNSAKYIDSLFDAKARQSASKTDLEAKLDVLLGVQTFRKFFFDPRNLEDFLQQRYNGDKYAKTRAALEYLLPQANYNSQIDYASQRNIGINVRPMAMPGGVVRGGGMNMKLAAAPMEFFAAGPAPAAAPAPPPAPMIMVDAKVAKPNGSATTATTLAAQPQELDAKLKKAFDEAALAEKLMKRDNILHRRFEALKDGSIKGSLKLPAVVTNFSFRIYLVSDDGFYGYSEVSMPVRKEFNIVVDPPLYLYKDEVFDLQLTLENNSAQFKQVFFDSPAVALDVPANGSASFKASVQPEKLPLLWEAKDGQGNVLTSKLIKPAVVNPGIFKKTGKSGYVGADGESKLEFSEVLPESLVRGNNALKVCFKNSAIGVIIEAVKQLNRQPYGCFEQASTVSFPLVLGLKILQALPQTPDIAKLRAEMLANLKKGIELLLKYECKTTGGFEWFGKEPCHSTLTAYGLWQFLEISTLESGAALFDSGLLARLQSFLQASRNSAGGFVIRRGLDALGNPPQDVSDVYIVMVLTLRYDWYKSQFSQEIEAMKKLFEKFLEDRSKLDSYKLALLGLTFLNTGDAKWADEALATLVSRQDKATGEIKNAQISITRSAGVSLAVETTALTLTLALKAADGKNKHAEAIDLCIKFLTANMRGSAYSSTQATILSLWAIGEYIKGFKASENATVDFNIGVNGTVAGQIKVTGSAVESKCLDLIEALRGVEQPGRRLSVVVAPAGSAGQGKFLFSVDFEYYAELPASTEGSPLEVKTTKTGADSVFVYEVSIRNLVGEDHGMTVYEFNKPSCYDFNINDLDSLALRKLVDFFEIRESNSQLVFYYRGLKANSSVGFSFSMSKRYGLNDCRERAHSAYLYYNKEGSIVYLRP